MKVGDKVRIIDGSYAVRVDSYESCPSIGLCIDLFEIVDITNRGLKSGSSAEVHDMTIRNTVNGKMYLHSRGMVRVVERPAKEMTMLELESHFGRKVKIIK